MTTHGPLGPILMLLAATTSAVHAQPRPDPREAAAPGAAGQAAAGGYRSAFEGYRPYQDARLLPWPQVNETVRSRGGWRAYAREAQAPQPAASEPASPAAARHGDRR